MNIPLLLSLWLACGAASAASYTVQNPCPGHHRFAYNGGDDLLLQCQLGGAGQPTPKGVPYPVYVTRLRIVDATCKKTWLIYGGVFAVCQHPKVAP